jgi:hypothetical protein
MLTCDSNILTCEDCLDCAPSIIPHGPNIFTLGIVWLMVQTLLLMVKAWTHDMNIFAYG